MSHGSSIATGTSRRPWTAFLSATALLWGCASEAESEPSTTTTDSTSSTTTATGGAGGTGTGGHGGAGGSGGQGGSGGTALGCVDLDATVFAVDEFFFGDRSFGGVTSADAWKQFGTDIDGLVTVPPNVTGHCTPNAGGSPNNFGDGDAGIDNSFGKNVLPMLLGLAPTFPDGANAQLASGEYTMLLRLEALGAAADQASIVARLYGGAPLGAPAVFDGTDCWPVLQEQLTDPTDIDASKVVYPQSSLAGNVWSSGSPTTLTLTFTITGLPLTFTLEHAIVTMQLDPNHLGATLGQISGVLDTEVFAEEIKQLAGSFDPSLCSGSTIDSILNQIRQASDILKNGTQSPDAGCDGISVGLGFTAKTAQLGGIAPPVQPPPDPCP